MKVISDRSLSASPILFKEVAAVLRDDGLICFPTRRQYAVAASLYSDEAVLRLVQSKRRASKAPSLVFIRDRAMLYGLVEQVPRLAGALMDAFWPGPLTLLLPPGPSLSPKVSKTIVDRKRQLIGVRVATGFIPSHILMAFGGPLLVSSANLSHKVGSSSVAQIRKNFTRSVDLLIDAGDIPPAPPSTIVEFEGDQVRIQRDGAISAEQIQQVIDAALRPPEEE